MESAAVAVAARPAARVAEAALTVALAARRAAAAFLAAERPAFLAAQAPQPADVNVAGAAVARIARARVWAMPPTLPNRRAAIAVPGGPNPGLPVDARARLALPTRPTVRCRCSDANGRRVRIPAPAAPPAPGFAAASGRPLWAATGCTPTYHPPRRAALAE